MRADRFGRPTPHESDVCRLLIESVAQLGGGRLAVGGDPMQIADGIEAHITARRETLGI